MDDRLYLTEGETFDLILSNPPVHLGLQPEFTVLSSLVAGCKERLNPGRVVNVSLAHSRSTYKRRSPEVYTWWFTRSRIIGGGERRL